MRSECHECENFGLIEVAAENGQIVNEHVRQRVVRVPTLADEATRAIQTPRRPESSASARLAVEVHLTDDAVERKRHKRPFVN